MSEWGKKPSYIQQRRYAARLNNEREAHERHLASIDRIADALESTKTQEQTDDDKRAFREKLTIWLLVFTVLFTGAADVIFYDTLKDARKSSREQLRRLDSQLGLMAASSQQTDTQIAVTKDLAASAKDQATAAREGAGVARDNIVAGSRAWVGPNGASVDGAITTGNPAIFVINYQNSGRQPATGFVSYIAPFIITADEANSPISKIPENVANCRRMEPIEGAQVVYPSTGFGGNQYHTTIDKSLVDDQVIKGDKLIVIVGCFSYITFDLPHHSASCFFYKGGTTKGPELNFCAHGSYAD
jgi:hypothetical protein